MARVIVALNVNVADLFRMSIVCFTTSLAAVSKTASQSDRTFAKHVVILAVVVQKRGSEMASETAKTKNILILQHTKR